jgi:hypothetical protein
MIPFGNGLVRVAPRFGVKPPSSVAAMLVIELFKGELYGPRLNVTTLGR